MKGVIQKSLLIGIIFAIGIIVAAEISFRIIYKNYGNKEVDNQRKEFIDSLYTKIYNRCFEKIKKEGKDVYVTHRKVPYYQHFSVHKGKDTLRIFTVGGSVAEGYYPKFDYLQKRFQKYFPDKHFEIISCGVGGYDSYRVSLMVKEILNYQPDLIIVMSGNNEAYTPVRLNANIHLYRLSQSLNKRMVLFQYLTDKYSTWMKEKLRGEYEEDKKSRLKEYRQNITKIIKWTKKRNIPLIICTMPANFRDWPPECNPNWEVHPWESKIFRQSWGLYANGSYYKAINGFERFLEEIPENALIHFYLGRCYEKANDFVQAKFHYLKAVEYDAAPGNRCPPFRNSLLRLLSKQHDIILVDLVKAFEDLALHNLVGVEFFLDHCHWWSYYYDLVSQEIVKCVIHYTRLHPDLMNDFNINRFPDNNLEKESFPLKDLGAEEGFYFLLLTAENLYVHHVWEGENDYFSEISLLFLEQAYRIEPIIFTDIDKLKETINTLLNNQPDILPYKLSASLTELLPAQQEKFWSTFFTHIAEMLRRNHKFHEALEYANEALKGDSPWDFAYLYRGLIYASLRLDEQAEMDFKKAEELLPENCWVKFRDDLIITSLQRDE